MNEEAECRSKTTTRYKAVINTFVQSHPATNMLSRNMLRLIIFVLVMLVASAYTRSVFVRFFYCQANV